MKSTSHIPNRGFTLLEMAIVLTIIGLITGAILAGQELIAASAVRATIAQIDSYKRAVATFQYKFGALPGDINSKLATQYGFTARGTLAGEGDGNGVIQSNVTGQQPYYFTGEPLMFWVDLSYANGLNLNLVDGSFSSATPTMTFSSNVSGTGIDLYLPRAKIGNGNYIYVWSGGAGWSGAMLNNGINYYGLSALVTLYGGYEDVFSNANIPVSQASAIDNKIDDGLPCLGNVTTQYINAGVEYVNCPPAGNGTTSPSPTTCSDDGGANLPLSSYKYTMSVNNGAGPNCALSFQF